MHKDINVNVSGPVQPTSTYKTVVLKGQVPFASQVTEPNTKYVIKHNFDLSGGAIVYDGWEIEGMGGNPFVIDGEEYWLTDYESGIAEPTTYTLVDDECFFVIDNHISDIKEITLQHEENTWIATKRRGYHARILSHLDPNAAITIPENCILEFDGGSLRNGLVKSNKTILCGMYGKNTCNYYGLFCDLHGNPLTINVTKADNYSLKTVFGNFIQDIDNGLNFGAIQGFCVNSEYCFIGFNGTYRGIIVYDKKYNYIGYAILDNLTSHMNDFTICDDHIYIANGDDLDGLTKVSISSLLAVAPDNNGKAFAESENLGYEHIQLGKYVHGIDYDAVTNTFCIGSEAIFYAYNKNFELIGNITTSDYRLFLQEKYHRSSTVQGIVFDKGIIYAFDWDFVQGDNFSFSTILYIIDAVSGEVENVYPLNHKLGCFEIEGCCKDTDGNILCAGNNGNGYSQPRFYVCNVVNNLLQLSAIVKISNDSETYLTNSETVPVYVSNNYEGYSTGTKNQPFKTIGEAIVLASVHCERLELVIRATENPYYSYDIKLSGCSLKIGSLNSNVPELDISLTTRNVICTLEGVKLSKSKPHPRYNIIEVRNESVLQLNNVEVANTGLRAIGISNDVSVYCNNATFSGVSGDRTTAFEFLGYNSTLYLRSITINDNCCIARFYDQTCRTNRIKIENVSNLTLNNGFILRSAPTDIETIDFGFVNASDFAKIVALIDNSDGEGGVSVDHLGASNCSKVTLGESTTLNGISVAKGTVFYDDGYTDDNNANVRYFRILGSLIQRVSGSVMEVGQLPSINGRGSQVYCTDILQPLYYDGGWRYYDGLRIDKKRTGLRDERPAGSGVYVGLQYMQVDAVRGTFPVWASAIEGTTVTWIKADGTHANTKTSGTFADKPTVATRNIPVGFGYFCTDKQTVEGATDGIMIYHKGSDVWVDALGRVVS